MDHGLLHIHQISKPTVDSAKKALLENWNIGYWYKGVWGLGILLANIFGLINVTKNKDNLKILKSNLRINQFNTEVLKILP